MRRRWLWWSGLALVVGMLAAGWVVAGQVGTTLFIEEDGTVRWPLSDTGLNYFQLCNAGRNYCHRFSVTGAAGPVYTGICDNGSCATDITTALNEDMTWKYGTTDTHTMLQGSNDFRPTANGWISPRSGTANVSTLTADCNAAAEAGRMYIDTDESDSGMVYVCDGSGWRQQGWRIVTKSIVLLDPVTGDTGKTQFIWPGAVTITRVDCSTNVATSTATINLDERALATPDTNGTDTLSAGLVCSTINRSSCASGCDVNTITDTTIAAGVPHALEITATANTPTALRVHVTAILQ